MSKALALALAALLNQRSEEGPEFGPPVPLPPEALEEQRRHEAAVDAIIARKRAIDALVGALNADVGAEQKRWRARMEELLPDIVGKDAQISLDDGVYRVGLPDDESKGAPARPEWVDEIIQRGEAA